MKGKIGQKAKCLFLFAVGWIFFQVWYTYIYIYIYSLFFRFTTFYGQYADIFQVPSVSDITNHLLYILNHPSDIRNMSFAGMSWRLPGLSGRRCRAPRCTRHSSWRRTLTKKKHYCGAIPLDCLCLCLLKILWKDWNEKSSNVSRAENRRRI